MDENKRQITTGITDENGIATFSLGYGKYFYHEIAAPEEYIIDDTLYPFEITEEGVSVYAKMTNYLKEGSIKVTKTTTGNLNIKDIRFVVKGISTRTATSSVSFLPMKTARHSLKTSLSASTQ